MERYLSALKRTRLFAGIKEEEIASLLRCLNARMKHYEKGAYIFRQGERIGEIALLLEGSLHIQRDDYWGNRSILGSIGAGELFGEAYMGAESSTMHHDVVAVTDSAVIFFDVRRVITTCPSACRFHAMVVQNLFFAISEKNRKLVQKLGHMSKRTTREKLISYLSEAAERSGSASFTIPFNRQQLADFLSVDRSAMSNELSKMRDEGLLTYEKNSFRLL